MSSEKKLRPGVANDHEIRLNLRLLRGRDGPLFKAVHELVANLGPRQRVEALRLWMMAAATNKTGGKAGGPELAVAVEAGSVAHPNGSAIAAKATTAEATPPQVAGATPHVSSSGGQPTGKLDMSQLNGVEMDLDFMGTPAQ